MVAIVKNNGHVYPADVKKKYFAGGLWKHSIIAKQGKHRHEGTKPGRIYFAIPPAEGWPGGLPEANGFRVKGGK